MCGKLLDYFLNVYMSVYDILIPIKTKQMLRSERKIEYIMNE